MDDSAEIGEISTAKTKTGKTILLHTWFTQKLGFTAGDRLFKEFVKFASDAAPASGSPGVLLDVRGGRIVSISPTNLE